MSRRLPGLFLTTIVLSLAAICHAQTAHAQTAHTQAAHTQTAPDTGWPTYGGDPGGQRYTTARQITAQNLSELAPVWTFHTHALDTKRAGSWNASFEATPILFHDTLYVSSPFDEVFAVNPETGAQLWKYDPVLRRNLNTGVLTSRGVAAWSSGSAGSACSDRIFIATMDTRLIALDAATGKPCADFGTKGQVDLTRQVHYPGPAPYYNSSPPTVIGNVVVVGSAIGDNAAVNVESGLVRGFDARTGKLIWSWEPLPWAAGQRLRTGAGNAWAVIAADPEHNLVFIPTGAPSSDFYGGTRPGDDRDANSVVALEATTGRRVWGFQVVHHDLWDYDVASEPLLFTFHGASGKENIPAVAVTTKQGLIFLLNRLTGAPLYPIHERPVPASDVPGEHASPTQPFQDIPTLSPITLPPDAMLGASAADNAACRQLISKLRYDGIYTPPSLKGTLAYPGNLGGVNWGSAAIDPVTGILYANTNRYAYMIQFQPRHSHLETRLLVWREPRHLALLFLFALFVLLILGARFSVVSGRVAISVAVVALIAYGIFFVHIKRQTRLDEIRSAAHFGRESGEQFGTPYTVLRQQVIVPGDNHPCTPMPWGTVSAVNLNTAQPAWQTPLGTLISGEHTGTINLGGDLVTASGLVFSGASENPYLRAYAADTGKELWQGRLPVPAQATPMSYTLHGRQYIVIAAGGHGLFGTPTSDAVVAFALPKTN